MNQILLSLDPLHKKTRKEVFSDVSRFDGNPPDKPKAPEVEFSMKEVLREEVEIY